MLSAQGGLSNKEYAFSRALQAETTAVVEPQLKLPRHTTFEWFSKVALRRSKIGADAKSKELRYEEVLAQ